MSFNKKYQTGYQKRSLSYTSTVVKQSPLDLPEKYHSKISHAEFKKVKEAYFVNSNSEYILNYDGFVKTIRSLGIVVRTGQLYAAYGLGNFKSDKNRNQKSVAHLVAGKTMGWQAFLDAYIGLRNNKGSFKEVDTAINMLDKEYKGRWEMLYKDLRMLGDVLSEHEIEVFKQQIMKDQIINAENLKNTLLGYK